MEGNNDVVVISENNPMKTNAKQKKKVIKNKEKIVFGFKFREQYKYKFWKKKTQFNYQTYPRIQILNLLGE